MEICEICGKIQHYKKMDLRRYTKQELALLYFPDSDPDVARAHLMRWIVRCTQLYEQLLKSGYNKSCKKMDLRSYTKQELALLYFPDSDPDVARAHLMRWIVRCTQLYEQLLKSGYNKSCKVFNPLQVSYIFFHL